MMKELKEKRELLIDDKIFTIEDVVSLIKLAVKASEAIQAKSSGLMQPDFNGASLQGTNTNVKYPETSHSCIELTCSDNSKLSFSFGEIKEAADLLSKERIEVIDLFFNENIYYSKFKLKLRTHGSSYFRVEGSDSEWVNSTIKSIDNFIESCRTQSLFVKKFRLPVILAIILILTLFQLNMIQLFIKTQVSFPKIVGSMFREDLGYYLVFMILIAAAPAVFIYRWLRNLFPGIEIQTGEDFQIDLRKRRLKLLLFASVIIISIILSFFLRRI
jgi:hypothetical protein